jgi:hypothetical protein
MQGGAGIAVFHTPDCTQGGADTLGQVFLAESTYTTCSRDLLTKAMQRTRHRMPQRNPPMARRPPLKYMAALEQLRKEAAGR